MIYTELTPMVELLAGMAAVDADACHEFARRQHIAGYAADLATAAGLIHDLAFAAQLERPDELMRWKYPEHFEPLDTDLLARLLQAASEDDRATAQALISNQPFAAVTALSSIASHLRQSLAHIARHGTRTPDPQQSLF